MLKLTAHFQLNPNAAVSVEADNPNELIGVVNYLRTQFGTPPASNPGPGEAPPAQSAAQDQAEATVAGEAPKTTQRRTRGSTKGAQDGNAAQAADTQKTDETPAATTQPVTKPAGKSSGEKLTVEMVTKAIVDFANDFPEVGIAEARAISKKLGVARFGDLKPDQFQTALDEVAAARKRLSANANEPATETAADLI
jgi:hypothetical protein